MNINVLSRRLRSGAILAGLVQLMGEEPAFDYLKKPFEPEELEIVVARAVEHARLVRENHPDMKEFEASHG